MIQKIINLGVSDNLKTEEAQIVRLTNIIASIPAIAYLFYLWYGWYYGYLFSFILATSMLLCTGIALFCNSRKMYGLAKTILFIINSFSVWLTYHVFNVDYSVLSSFFPILFCFPLFFDLKREKAYFIIALGFVVLSIISSFIIERHQIHSITLSETEVEISNLFHISLSFLLTGLVAFAVFRNRDKTYEMLILESDKAKETLNDLQKMQAQLVHSEKMASLGIMLAGISHEINNPLNFLKGSMEGLKSELKELNFDLASKKYFVIMDEGVQRIGNIVKSLNHFNYQAPTFDQDCDLRLIFENCLNILNHELKKGIKIKRDFAPNSSIKGNSGQLHQVFLNLIANSIQAMPSSGTIMLRTESRNGHIHAFVEDDGEGIAPEKQYKIFDPFFTTKDPGKGTGLGLAIAYQIVKDHGGEITMASQEGYGTSIRLRLPKEKLN